jgi:acetylornithine deacetylase/succinyl-diaminopimelate desuccinylase-like protein
VPTDLIHLCQQLVRIPSVNPDNGPNTEQTGEAALARFLQEWLEALGAHVTLEEVRPGRPNLIARFAPLDGRPRVLFGPHLDTVGIAGMTIPPFDGTISNGKLWGRGSSDTKGSMAAMLWALRKHARILPDLPVAVDFVAFMGEESGQWGSKEFAAKHAADYQFAIVGEPTSLQVVHVTKGSLWATLQATGKAAHSSQPERGDNAILKLTRAIQALDRDLGRILAGFTHPILGRSTMNIGMIRGGSRPNVVPDLAEAELDIRVTPSLAASGGGLSLLRDTIAALGLSVRITTYHENPPMETPAGHPMIGKLLASRPGTQCVGAPWFSDAAHLSRGGIPSVCIGPGSINQAHTADEFIALDELQAGGELLAEFISQLSAPPARETA